jgi:diguanylate cyclase (GGDEF)-like protein/PAS domain S-box-containing protein
MNSHHKEHSKEIDNLCSKISKLEEKNRLLAKQLQATESLYLKVLDSLPINIFLEDRDGRTIFANKNACKLNGIDLEELIGKTVFDFFPTTIAEINRANDLEVWEQKKLITKEVIAGFKGQEHHMFTGKTIIQTNDSSEEYLLGFGLDITDRINTEKLLKESEEKFRSVIEQAADSYFLIGTDNMLKDCNPTACEVLNYSKNELLLSKTNMIFTRLPEKLQLLMKDTTNYSSLNFEDQMIGRNNAVIPVDINIRLITIGEKKMFFALCRDIRDKKSAETQIKHMAYHDALTGLPNRWHLQSYLEDYISDKNTNHSKLGVILLDLDYFKIINDSLGHHAGDILLKEVSKRLLSSNENHEFFLSRFGGDEFILLVPDYTYEEDIFLLCESILTEMVHPFYINEQKFTISASIGISLYPQDGQDLHTLIKNADLAMYESKEKGRNCYNQFKPLMKNQLMERMVKLTNMTV